MNFIPLFINYSLPLSSGGLLCPCCVCEQLPWLPVIPPAPVSSVWFTLPSPSPAPALLPSQTSSCLSLVPSPVGPEHHPVPPACPKGCAPTPSVPGLCRGVPGSWLMCWHSSLDVNSWVWKVMALLGLFQYTPSYDKAPRRTE